MSKRTRRESGEAPARLTRAELSDHLILEEVATRRVVMALRDAVLKAAPMASEGVKFRVLCYFHGGAFFKSIGGNICMIEVKNGRVVLSFIRGSLVENPAGLMSGKGKFKRFVPIADVRTARSAEVHQLVARAAALEPWT